MNPITRAAIIAAVDFLNNDDARDLLGLHRIRVGQELMTRGEVADMLQAALASGVMTKGHIGRQILEASTGQHGEVARQCAEAWSDMADKALFQFRVDPWLQECFGPEIAGDREERNHRFLEESLELVQSLGCSASEAHQLVDYVFGRPVGEPAQETGGVMVTLAALCLANKLDMHQAGDTELARISTPEMTARIRAKNAAKPKHSPLPGSAP